MRIKIVTILSLLLVFIAPVFALSYAKNSNNGQNHKEISSNIANLEDDNKPTGTVTPTITPIVCDPNAAWRNHGQYVSCIAHEKLGGKTVSEAARSDIGKKNEIENDDEDENENENRITPTPMVVISPTVTPTISVTPTITPTPTETSELTVTPTMTPTITVTPTGTQQESVEGVSDLQKLLQSLRDLFKTLFK